MKKNVNKKAILSILAVAIGSSAQASIVDKTLKDPVFSLKEASNQSILIAHGKEGACGEGKCGGKKGKKAGKKSKEAKVKDAAAGETAGQEKGAEGEQDRLAARAHQGGQEQEQQQGEKKRIAFLNNRYFDFSLFLSYPSLLLSRFCS